MNRQSMLLAILALFTCTLLSCTSTTYRAGNGNTDNTEPLKVGISTNAPPFAYKANGQLQGLEVDFARQLGQFLGRKIDFVVLDWNNQLDALEKGKTDIIMSGMTITPRRQYRATFTQPYLRSGQMLLVRTPEKNRYQRGIYSLMGNTPHIGTITGTSGDLFITKTINRPRITRFSTSKEAVKALADNTIDVLVHDAPIVCHWAATYDDAQLSPILQMANEEYLGWAVARTNPALLQSVNSFVDAGKASGQLRETIQRWIPFM